MKSYRDGVAAGLMLAIVIDSVNQLARGKEGYVTLLTKDWPSPTRLLLVTSLCVVAVIVFTVSAITDARKARRGR